MSAASAPPPTGSAGLRLVGLTALVMVAFAANSVLNRMALEGGAGASSFALIRLISGAALLGLLVSLRGEARALRPTRATRTRSARRQLWHPRRVSARGRRRS